MTFLIGFEVSTFDILTPAPTFSLTQDQKNSLYCRLIIIGLKMLCDMTTIILCEITTFILPPLSPLQGFAPIGGGWWGGGHAKIPKVSYTSLSICAIIPNVSNFYLKWSRRSCITVDNYWPILTFWPPGPSPGGQNKIPKSVMHILAHRYDHPQDIMFLS
jgi:hypothetical protein